VYDAAESQGQQRGTQRRDPGSHDSPRVGYFT
jgi:hypothetical protein